MKTLSKLLALLLALAMVFCLVACGSDNDVANNDDDDKGSSSVEKEETEQKQTDAEKIVGNWVCNMDLSKAMAEELEVALGDDSIAPSDSFYMNLSLDFDDGEFTLSVEIDKNSLENYMAALVDNMVDYMYDMAEEEGMSKEDFETTFEEQYGMTLQEYVAEQADLTVEGFADEMSSEVSGYYELDEDEGYIYVGEDEDELDTKEEAMEYSFNGKELTISGIISDGEKLDDPLGFDAYGVDLPWTFVKK